jgi:hypothetical protein
MLANGKTFYFKINGVPVFIEGANWIPADSFPTRTNTSTVRHLMESARAANMNMVRKLQPLGVSCLLTLCYGNFVYGEAVDTSPTSFTLNATDWAS